MKYTYHHAPPLARPCEALQIFSAKVITGLRWPLHVFGMVAVRDYVDRNRNLLFCRIRDNCQTLGETVCIIIFSISIVLVVSCCVALPCNNLEYCTYFFK
ncbi:hypothetical protein PR202_ga29136 [Eleusine coracana subsp. coracana]|uniref:DUF6598 domain-containing protein n=1 Tax=Eleusine coracana subsp. coracana TaxID=191504 RepID=A0AAV5DKD9_ELECO|nr:hypothetical protein PR202_ga29136 [Eleusine coracana subsp. coracana]